MGMYQTDTGLRSYDRAAMSSPVKLLDTYSWNGFGVLLQPPQRKPVEFEVPALLDHVAIIYLNTPADYSATIGGGAPRALRPRPGYASVVPAGSDSRWSANAGDVDCVHLHLSPDRMEQLIGSDVTKGQPLEVLPNMLAADDALTFIGRACAAELRQPGIAGRALMESLAVNLGVRLLRHYSSMSKLSAENNHAMAPYRLQLAREFIEAYLGEDIGLSEIAGAAGLSVFHFSRCFRTSTGRSPYRYLVERRIAKAKDLLRNSSLAVSQIALICGFSSQQHLASTFTKLVGSSPGRYRRNS